MSKDLLKSPLVSVIVSSYNYARFLCDAIDSALNQTYPNIEVIVVDDGSTDNSREIIANYEDRIVPVLKENGGQASACNAGFAISKGEIVIFLDADDVLLTDTVRRIAAAFQTRPDVVKVQCRQQVIDEYGEPTGEFQPPNNVHMPSGDLRQHILHGSGYTSPSTSGNAYATAVLRRILPMPEDLYRGMPDIHLCNLSAVFGSIISLDGVGVLYRIHGNNSYYGTINATNVAVIRKTLLAVADSHARQRYLFDTLYSADARTVGSRDIYFLSNRVISLRLDPVNHPFTDNLLSLCLRGCILSITAPGPDMYKYTRLLFLLWFGAMLFAPRPFAGSLTEMLYYRERRGWLLNKLLPLLRRIR